ncbi:MAG: SLC13 family permease [Archangium sp.]|nr:SLC13 family permease [Archangium sp.]
MALAVFLLTYVFLAGFKLPWIKLDRTGAALVGAAAMVGLGIIKPSEVAAAVDVDTLVLLLGMMLLAAYLTRAAFFRATAYYVLVHSKTPRGLLFALVMISGLLSAFLVNDTVCLMLTPLVLMLVKSADLPPLPYLLGLCMASNAGSVATFTGNPQNMIIGVASKIPYAQFIAYMALPALLSLLVVLGVLLFMFRKELPHRSIHPEGPPPPVDRRLMVICSIAVAGILVAFFAGLPLSWSALVGATAVMVVAGIDPEPQYKKIDLGLLLFFACLFIVVHGVNEDGWALAMRELFAPLMVGGPIRESFGFTALTLLASNLFSNVPFVMLARVWVPGMTDPLLGWQVLALASTLAGNLTLIGSVANLIVFEGAKDTIKVTFWQYFRVGAPATLLSLVIGLATLLAERALFG